jgi:hypothetical protein
MALGLSRGRGREVVRAAGGGRCRGDRRAYRRADGVPSLSRLRDPSRNRQCRDSDIKNSAASLLARLDRLGGASWSLRSLAPEFGALLGAVTGEPAGSMGIERRRFGVVTPPAAPDRCAFRHALIRTRPISRSLWADGRHHGGIADARNGQPGRPAWLSPSTQLAAEGCRNGRSPFGCDAGERAGTFLLLSGAHFERGRVARSTA